MPGGWEWLIIIVVLVVLFGAKRLPEMARSVGQSARVFKGEMKGFSEDEEKRRTARDSDTSTTSTTSTGSRTAEPDRPAALPPAQQQPAQQQPAQQQPAQQQPTQQQSTATGQDAHTRAPQTATPEQPSETVRGDADR